MNGKIDVDLVKQNANLLSLIGGHSPLRRVAATGGGEWAGPCPFCGGRDRLRVQPYARPFPIWLCRNCTDGRWQDGIEFTRRLLPGMGFKDICSLIAGDLRAEISSTNPQPLARPAAAPPGEEWQESARRVIAECQNALWRNGAALDYLHSRGLEDRTIKRFQLGYSYGREIAGLYVPRGVVIPCVAKGAVWYLKIRLLPGEPCRCARCKRTLPGPGECPACGEVTKYAGVRGNRTAAIFNGDDLATYDLALFVEGEIDAMTAWQGLNDILPVATLGAATNRVDLAVWGRYFVGKKTIFLAYDNDDAGRKGAAAMREVSKRCVDVLLPDGAKDINEYFQAGGDLWKWIEPYLNQYDPIGYDWNQSMEVTNEQLYF